MDWKLANVPTWRPELADFIYERVNPGTVTRDAQGLPISRELLREAAAHSLLGATLPPQVGGAGYGLEAWGLLLEAIGYACEDNSLPLLVSLFAAVTQTVYDTGRADLIERYVRPAVRGERLISFAWTENADPFAFASTATRDGEDYIVSGAKFLVTGGMLADAFMTYVADERGDVIALLIDRDLPGVSTTPVPTMGMRAAGLAALRLEQVRVPARQVIVPNDGISHVQRFLNRRRVLVTCGFLGRIRAVLEQTVAHLGDTIRYGAPLTILPTVQASVGRMVMAVETAQLVVHGALARLGAGDYRAEWDAQLSIAKHFLIERAIEVGDKALHLWGGAGYVTERHMERNLRDFYGFIAGAGAQDILEVDIGGWYINQAQRAKEQIQ